MSSKKPFLKYILVVSVLSIITILGATIYYLYKSKQPLTVQKTQLEYMIEEANSHYDLAIKTQLTYETYREEKISPRLPNKNNFDLEPYLQKEFKENDGYRKELQFTLDTQIVTIYEYRMMQGSSNIIVRGPIIVCQDIKTGKILAIYDFHLPEKDGSKTISKHAFWVHAVSGDFKKNGKKQLALSVESHYDSTLMQLEESPDGNGLIPYGSLPLHKPDMVVDVKFPLYEEFTGNVYWFYAHSQTRTKLEPFAMPVDEDYLSDGFSDIDNDGISEYVIMDFLSAPNWKAKWVFDLDGTHRIPTRFNNGLPYVGTFEKEKE